MLSGSRNFNIVLLLNGLLYFKPILTVHICLFIANNPKSSFVFRYEKYLKLKSKQKFACASNFSTLFHRLFIVFAKYRWNVSILKQQAANILGFLVSTQPQINVCYLLII